jgi:amino acid transporter
MRFMPEAATTPAPGTKLGTFAGVFTPSILTILGIILFLRVGYIVGAGGLGASLLILALATAVSVLTSLSLAAIATNLKVKKGGDYYLISRTLGMEFGGAIGIVLFLAQSVSIAFYCIGFGEAVAGVTGLDANWATQPIAAGALLFLLFFAWLGADWATRVQFLIMGVLTAALASFFIGGIGKWSSETMTVSMHRPADGAGFWVLFAIFFPAVTGFTQGVSMSGDLRDPVKSLPRGTFLAIGVSTVVYVATMLVLAGSLQPEQLLDGFQAMQDAAWIPWLIVAGVLAATLSSAMASFLGAPRILQSLAGDRIFRMLTPFAHGVGPSQNPRRGVLLTAGIALATIALGSLNAVAAVVSMFFLVSYGLLNYATFVEARANSPAFRPTFRYFNAWLSFAAAVLCLGIGVAISPTSAAVAGALLLVVHQYIRRTARTAAWADSRYAYHFRRVRDHLYDMREAPSHARDWRPHILAFSKDAGHRMDILRFASWIEGEAGITTVARIFVGDDAGVRKRRDEAMIEMTREIETHKLRAFPLALASSELMEGARVLLQSYGVGPLRANTILLNWLEQTSSTSEYEIQDYGSYLRMALRLRRNVVVLAADTRGWQHMDGITERERRIDVWWCDDASSRLSLMLAYLMTRTADWDEASVRVIAVTAAEEDASVVRQHLTEMLEDVRIDAEVQAIAAPDEAELIRRSADAGLIFMPMKFRANRLVTAFGPPVQSVANGCPVMALVTAAEDVELAPDPDEGEPAEMAAAADRAEHAEQRARKAEEQAITAADLAEKLVTQAAERSTKADADKRIAQSLPLVADQNEDLAVWIGAIKLAVVDG